MSTRALDRTVARAAARPGTRRRRWSLSLLLLAAAPALRAQDAAAAAEAAAKAAEQAVVAALHERADALQQLKQYARALELRQQLIQEWAPGDEKALELLGFVKIGSLWRRDLNKTVFDKDLAGDQKALKKLDRDWERAGKDLAKQVERAAAGLASAGLGDRAMVFWRRLLLLRPGDKLALAALQLPSFDGHDGTPSELALLRRGRAFAQAAAFLHEFEPPVAEAEGKHPVLERAGIAHHGVTTEHLEVWGNLPLDRLQLAAQWAERAMALSRLVFDVSGGRAFHPQRPVSVIWTADRDSYVRALGACADQFDQQRRQFLEQEVDLAFIRVGDSVQRLNVLGDNGNDVLIDVTARGVVQDAAGLDAHALWEGLGHAVCGILFDKTLSFFVEQQQGNTVTSWKPRPLLPDMSTWRQIATESAWAANDTPTSRLMLLEGHKMTNEERVKAWALVDFLLRSRPGILFELQGSMTHDVRDELGVAAAFQRRTGFDIRTLDDDWRQYWATGKALREAMAQPARGSRAAVQGAERLARAVARARIAAGRGPVGYVVADGADTRAALGWLSQVVKHEKDAQRDPKKAGPAPAPPPALGRTVQLWRGDDVDAAVDAWLQRPALRDYLMEPGRQIFGCFADGDGVVLDLLQPALPVTAGLPDVWPGPSQRGVGTEVAVRDLDPAFQEPLELAGRGADAVVGMPMTLHFHRTLEQELRRDVTCRLVAGNLERDGVLVFADDQPDTPTPGLVAFVPLDPLPPGAEVRVRWTVAKAVVDPTQRLGGPELLSPVIFVTR